MREIRSLTSLRGFFAIMILSYHALELGFHIYQPVLSYGVECFFGLSGFLLYKIYNGNLKWKKFIMRRTFRIIPLYAFCVGVFYLSSITKFTVLWSIYTEEMFYFIALPLIIKYKPSTKLLLGLGVISEILRIVFFVIPAGYAQSGLNNGNLWVIYTLLPFQFFPFALGISIARRNIRPRNILVKIDRVLGDRLFFALGTISYGIYMVHVPLLGWFGWQWGIPATIALASCTYLLFEKSCIEYAREKTKEIKYE